MGTNKETVEKLYAALQFFYPWLFNANNVQRAVKKVFDYQGQKITSERFKDELLAWAQTEDDIAYAIRKLREEYQKLPKVEATRPGTEELKTLEEQARVREEAQRAAKEKGITQTQEFIESQLKRVKNIKVTPKEEFPIVTLDKQEKEKLYNLGVAVKTDPGTTQKIVEEKIQEALSKSPKEIQEATPQPVITKAAVDFVNKVTSFGDYKTAEEIPDKISVMHPASPIAAVALVNDAKLKGFITDEQARKILAQNAQSVALAIETERNVNATLTRSFLYDSPDITAVLYGPEQITQFEISDDQSDKNEDGIDIDVGEIIDRGKDIRDVWEKIATGRVTAAETAEATTTFVSSYTPSINVAATSQASSLIIKALPVAGAITGFQGSVLASQWIAHGTPLLLNSQLSGLIGSGSSRFTALASLATQGEILYYAGVGKYSFTIAKLTKGSVDLYAAGLNFGNKGFGLGAIKIGGKVVSTGTITSAGGKIAGKALPAIFTRIGAFLGSVGPVIGTLIGAALGWIAGKIIEKIPWKKVLPFLVGGLLLPFFGPVAAIAGGLGTALIGGATLAGIGAGIGAFFWTLGRATAVTIGAPIIVTLLVFPVVVALILFIINSGAYIVPPSIVSQRQSENPYIDVQKVANPEGPFQNSDLPITITYTITITAKKGALTNISMNNICKIIQQGSQSPCPAEEPKGQDIPTSITPSSPFVFTYEEKYEGQDYYDSLVIDTFTVKADTIDQKGVTTTGSASITIGNPPTDCLVIDGNWPSDYKTNISEAVNTLTSNYSSYLSKVCSSYEQISLRYNQSGYGNYWGWNHVSYIDFYSLGVSGPENALYTLSHELGHSLIWGAQTAYIFAEYLRYPGVTTEKPLCFYSDAAGVPDEELPEAIAFYIIPTRSCSLTGDTSDISNWPIHLQFLKKYIFN